MRPLISVLLILFSFPAFALAVDEPLADDALEARARLLFTEIRCVVCQSEAIADSPAEVARDMRREVRMQVADGRSDREIKEDLSTKYGDMVLMKPPLKKSTIFLWFAPWVILFTALVVGFFKLRTKSAKI